MLSLSSDESQQTNNHGNNYKLLLASTLLPVYMATYNTVMHLTKWPHGSAPPQEDSISTIYCQGHLILRKVRSSSLIGLFVRPDRSHVSSNQSKTLDITKLHKQHMPKDILGREAANRRSERPLEFILPLNLTSLSSTATFGSRILDSDIFDCLVSEFGMVSGMSLPEWAWGWIDDWMDGETRPYHERQKEAVAYHVAGRREGNIFQDFRSPSKPLKRQRDKNEKYNFYKHIKRGQLGAQHYNMFDINYDRASNPLKTILPSDAPVVPMTKRMLYDNAERPTQYSRRIPEKYRGWGWVVADIRKKERKHRFHTLADDMVEADHIYSLDDYESRYSRLRTNYPDTDVYHEVPPQEWKVSLEQLGKKGCAYRLNG